MPFQERLETGQRILTDSSLVSTESVDFNSPILFDVFIVDITTINEYSDLALTIY